VISTIRKAVRRERERVEDVTINKGRDVKIRNELRKNDVHEHEPSREMMILSLDPVFLAEHFHI